MKSYRDGKVIMFIWLPKNVSTCFRFEAADLKEVHLLGSLFTRSLSYLFIYYRFSLTSTSFIFPLLGSSFLIVPFLAPHLLQVLPLSSLFSSFSLFAFPSQILHPWLWLIAKYWFHSLSFFILFTFLSVPFFVLLHCPHSWLLSKCFRSLCLLIFICSF
jgi:hypothetical protein